MNRYLKQYLRTTRRQLRLSLLIVFTLAIGFVLSYYIYSYVSYELSYDKDLRNNLYRVNMETLKGGEMISKTARTSPPIGPLAVDGVPGITSFSRLVLLGEVIILNGETTVREKDVLLADPVYFDQFQYSWISGDQLKMNKLNMVVISESLAMKIFGHTDVTGKEIEINTPNFEGSYPFTVAGVFEDHDGHSHLEPEMLISYATLYGFLGKEIDQSWSWNNIFTYVEADGDLSILNETVNDIFQDARGQDLENRKIEIELSLQPVHAIHTDNSWDGEFSKPVDDRQLLYVSILALLIFLMAFTNFLNLFLVRTVGKRSEMAVRTVLGSSKAGIMRITLADIATLHIIAAFAAFTIIQLLNPIIIREFEFNPAMLPGFAGQLLVIGVLTAFSIAVSFLLTYIRFANVHWTANLSGNRTTASRMDVAWYSYLLGIQLAIAVFFIAGSVVVLHQIQVISEYDTGLDLENKTVFKAPLIGTQDGIDNFKHLMWSEVSSISNVKDLVMTDEIPGSELSWRMDNVGLQPNEPA
ncbi:MAG: ABC transporter permease, partial [Cyclobacteriaceae bacterium]